MLPQVSVFLKIVMSFVFIKKNISMSKHAQAQITVDYFFFISMVQKKEFVWQFFFSDIFFYMIGGNRRQLNCSMR